MKRFFYFVVLMLLSSSAQAGNSFSFVVGGHRIRIDAPRSCRSPSCVSVSIPGIYQTHRARERDDIDAASSAATGFATRRSACDQAFHRTRRRGAASATNCAV